MDRMRLPLAALALVLLAACQSAAPTAPRDRQAPATGATLHVDTTTTLAREGSLMGSGN